MKLTNNSKTLLMKKRLLIPAGIALLLIALAAAIIYNNRSSTSASTINPPTATDKAVAMVKKQLAANPANVTLQVSLCSNYLQKVRETADPTYYDKCDNLLSSATIKEPTNANVIAAQSSLAYGRHDFIKGLGLAQQALSLNANKPAYYGLVGDGQIELGQYNQAASSFQMMINKRPDLSSYNRVAYIREIFGDIDGAKSALNSAVASNSSFPENVAYSQVELGKLYMRTDLNQAQQLYDQANNTDKNFPPALEGLGKVAVARGDYKKAITYFDQAFNSLPLAQYANDLADTYFISGDKNKAAQQYYLADLAFEKSSTGGVNNDFEKSVYLTDHDRNLKDTYNLAVKAESARPNIFSKDILAWNLYKLGRLADAQNKINEALVDGSNEPVINYHAGMIAAKLNQNSQAKDYLNKALGQDHYFLESHFSLLDKKLSEKTLNNLK